MEKLEAYKWFIEQNPILQALLAGLFTWGLTATGAALVFFFKTSNRKVLDMALGFTGGVNDCSKLLVFIGTSNIIC